MLPQPLHNPQLGQLLEQAYDIAEERADYQLQWLQTVGDCLNNLYGAENFIVTAQNRVLYTVNKVWEALSRDATYKWDYDFMIWAKKYTQRRGKLPADETIHNKITVHRDWVAECVIELPETVSIPERDESGKPTGNIIKIPFNAEECDYSKLLQARATAKDGALTAEAWSVLMDPYQTVNQLQKAMGKTKAQEEGDLKFYEQDGIIVAEKYGHRVEILMPIFEHLRDPLFKEAVAHVYGTLGITIPSELTK